MLQCEVPASPSVTDADGITDFLGQLKLKAGLKVDEWSDDLKAARFTTVSTSFGELGKAP